MTLAATPSGTDRKAIILYDGSCGLCNRFNRFVLRHDASDRFMFATLQGEFAHRILQSHSDDPDELSTIYVVLSCGGCDERLLGRSDAIIYILEGIGWASAATILAQLASPVRDWLYKIVARNRYRLFGKAELCPMLEASQRGKFLD